MRKEKLLSGVVVHTTGLVEGRHEKEVSHGVPEVNSAPVEVKARDEAAKGGCRRREGVEWGGCT